MKKFGHPKICTQCKKNAGFDKKDKDGKILCWLCFVRPQRETAMKNQNEKLEQPKQWPGRDMR